MKLLIFPILALFGASSPSLMASPVSEGQALATKNGCTGCHLMDRKTVGPSIRDIAKLYDGQKDASDALVPKVKQGCGGPWKGAWGQVPMPPNANIQNAHIKLTVDWMLQQK